MEPVLIAPNRVDFTVVAEIAKRLSAWPAGKGIGGETRVGQGECRLHVLAGQIWEVVAQLTGGEHALVGHGTAGEGTNVKEFIFVSTAVANTVSGEATNDIKLALKLETALADFATVDEKLAHDWLTGCGCFA